MDNDVLRIADKEFRSRLIVGTGKYRSFRKWCVRMKLLAQRS